MFFLPHLHRHPAFREGMRDVSPQSPGIAAWGLMTGVAMVKSGMSVFEAVAMTMTVFAGSSQLAAIPLIVAGAPAWVILATGFCVNLRFVVFSLHLRPFLMHLPLWQRLGGFDPGWFMYFEDADLCLRARLVGADVRVAAGLRLIHRGAGTQGTGPMAQLRRLTRATDGHLRYVARWGRRNHAYEPVLDGLTTAGYNLAYAVKLVVPALLARARKPGPRRP